MRSLLVSAAGLAVLVAYLALPTSSASRAFPIRYLKSFPEEWKIYRSFPDPRDRLRTYSRLNVFIPEMLRQYPPEAVVLLPPRDYALRFLPLPQTHWTDPRWIYYMNYETEGATRRSVIWGREGAETATVAVLLEQVEAENKRIRVNLVDLREPGAWDQVEAAYTTGTGIRP